MASRIQVTTTTEPEGTDKTRNEEVRQFLQLARERFQTISNAEAQLRQDMQDDLDFRAGDQWDQKSLQSRKEDGRPCLTIPRLGQFIRQVTNAQRSANLAVRVSGVDDTSDQDTAEVIQGLIRHIEQQSDAPIAYSTAGDHQATIGRGYWRVVTEYEGPKSFMQHIRIKRVRNPFTVFQDAASQEADGSDARYYFIAENMPKSEFRERFGEKAMQSIENWGELSSIDQEAVNDWMPEGNIRVAEYWYVASERKTLYLVAFHAKDSDVVTHHETMLQEEFDAIPEEIHNESRPEVVNERETELRTVRQALISGNDILEGNEDKTKGRRWPGQWIPIVPCIGDEIDLNGRLDLRGMVRDAKDPQRLYNIQSSTLAEALAIIPRAPYVGYEGQFEGHEHEWAQANRRAYAYLQVKPTSLDNVHPLPFPQRQSASADIGAIMTAIQQSDQDLKATMGLYEPSLGVRQSSGQSGKAIEALTKQGEQANSNFIDNLSRSIRFTGRLIIDLVPSIYDAQRVVRIIGEDETQKTVMVHANDKSAPTQPPEKIDGIYNVGVGKFDVVVNAGPSVETKRREAFEALNSFVQAYPAAFPMLGDLLVGNLDWPGAKEAAKRLKRAVPPQVVGDEEGQGEIPPQVAAQMQQLVEQLESTGMELKEAQALIQSKQLETNAKAAVERERAAGQMAIAQVREEASLEREQFKAAHEARMAELEAALDRLEQKLEHAHERGMDAQRRVDDRADGVVDRREARDQAVRTAGRQESGQPEEPVDLTRAT